MSEAAPEGGGLPPPMLYLDDIVVGERARCGPYEVTRDEVVDFARRYDPQPFHLDEAAAAANPLFGRLSASGGHSFAMALALLARHQRETGLSPSILGGIGIDELRWLKPVYPGDMLDIVAEAAAATPSRSKPDRGVLKTLVTVLRRPDEPVLRFMVIALVRRRPAD